MLAAEVYEDLQFTCSVFERLSQGTSSIASRALPSLRVLAKRAEESLAQSMATNTQSDAQEDDRELLEPLYSIQLILQLRTVARIGAQRVLRRPHSDLPSPDVFHSMALPDFGVFEQSPSALGSVPALEDDLSWLRNLDPAVALTSMQPLQGQMQPPEWLGSSANSLLLSLKLTFQEQTLTHYRGRSYSGTRHPRMICLGMFASSLML